MSTKRAILTLIIILTLSCSACGGDIDYVPVKPGTENIPDNGNDSDDDNQGDNTGNEDNEGDNNQGNEGDNEGGNEGGDSGDDNTGDDTTNESDYIVELSNSDFEQGMAGWETNNYKDAKQATVEIVEGMGVNGSKCVKISQKSNGPVCCMAVERVLTGLKTETLYRMTAKVKYENVAKCPAFSPAPTSHEASARASAWRLAVTAAGMSVKIVAALG